jgi:hypothetical protein
MDLKTFIETGLERSKGGLLRTLDGLTADELKWRPGPEANSIGLILFHQIRSEDSFVQSRIQGKKEIWETGNWYQKCKLEPTDRGAGYTVEQVAAFCVPPIDDLMGYFNAVRSSTLEYLKTLTPDKFDAVINLPRLGDMTIGALFALILLHQAQHAGEISYIRGLKRGMNK